MLLWLEKGLHFGYKNHADFEFVPSLWEGFWGIVIFGVEIENIGNELEIDSDLQVGY